MSATEKQERLTVKQAAELLSVSIGTVYDLVHGDKIPHYRLGGSGGAIRFKRADLEAYLEKCYHPGHAPAQVKPSRRKPAPSPRILKHLGDCLPASQHA